MAQTQKTAILLSILFCVLSLPACILPYLESTPIENALHHISPSSTVYTKNDMYLIDKKGGLSPDKFWKEATQKEIQLMAENYQGYLAREIIIKNDKSRTSEAYLLTLKNSEEEFYFNLSSKIKKGYFLITKQKKGRHRIFGHRLLPFASDEEP